MSIIYDQSRRRVGQVKRHPAIDAGGSSRATALAVKGLARERIHPKASDSIAMRSQPDCDTVTDEEGPLSGRVSDAGLSRSGRPGRPTDSEKRTRGKAVSAWPSMGNWRGSGFGGAPGGYLSGTDLSLAPQVI